MNQMRRAGAILLVVLSSQVTNGQSPCSRGTRYRNCKACGAATGTKAQTLNVQKNRDAKATHPQRITVEEIRDPDNDGKFKPSNQVWVTGYVAAVGPGGSRESCNCKRSNLRDVHINIVADPQEAGDETKYVVVEFTPRWEKKFNFDDSDYNAMLQAVKDEIEHKWVRFEGWMLYDYFHAAASESIHPGKAGNWRATPWEVHPVTAYSVATGPPQ